MSSSFFHKPELALRRAQELESIHQHAPALTLLHDVLSSRRHKTWSPTYEQIMTLYLDLCLKLGKSREAKDGLHQYRNLSQTQAPASLEKVILYLMQNAERKCTEAKAKADSSASADDADQGVEDLDQSSTPQSILLSTMSTDPSKTQRDSALLLPSLKFLWETYRAVLDILRSNSKLEHLYHTAAISALSFCRIYKRRTEFRRLCDMLRLHLGNLQKYGHVSADGDGKQSNKVRGWEGWTNESIELHLETRFAQLETASVLHLYTEGFRTVEDIYNILAISHTRRKALNAPPPKAKLMAAYYEKLTTLFWVSENYLFHGFAWYKYYTLCKEFNRAMSPETQKLQASAVLLAALCIPSMDSSRHGIHSTTEDAIAKEKMARMATLLGFHTRNPTRDALLAEIRSKNILGIVPDYLKELYVLLEDHSDPLVMVAKAKPLLEALQQEVGATTGNESEDVQDNTLGRYVKPLTSVLLLKLLLNLSSAYHTVSMDHLNKLTSGLGVTFEDVEKTIVLATQTKAISVRIDHRAGCLRFGNAALESDVMRSQLTVLAKNLSQVCRIIEPPNLEEAAAARIKLYKDVRENLEAEHAAVLKRKNTIEHRKEETERLAQEKERTEAERKSKAEAERKAEEENRRVVEQRTRETEKRKKIQREMERLEKEKYLTAIGRDTKQMTEEEIAKIDTDKLAKEHADKANKKKEEAERKAREVAKRLDYIVRAIRIEELPKVQRKYEDMIKQDRERYAAEVLEKAKQAKVQWEADVKEKSQLEEHSVFMFINEFEKRAMVGRKLKHKEACREADKVAELKAEQAKLDRARKRKEDAIKKQKEEEAKRKAEEEARKEEEERKRKEEERRKKQEEEEKRKQAELARMQEQERRERERQESKAPPSGRSLESASRPGGRYVPPNRRTRDGGGGGGGGGRFDRGGNSSYNDSRGGGYGGGRYEGRDRGGGGSDRRFGGGGDRREGDRFGDRREGDRFGGRRDGGGGGYGDRGGDRGGGGGYGDRGGDRGGGGGYGDRGGDRGGGYGDRGGDRGGDRSYGDRGGGRGYGDRGGGRGYGDRQGGGGDDRFGRRDGDRFGGGDRRDNNNRAAGGGGGARRW